MSGTHTPGPWRWELNKASKSVALLGGRPRFDKSVMNFERYGMSHAAPSFNNARLGEEGNLYNEMERCDKYGAIVQGREHHKDWFQEINHPDALLIAASPELFRLLREARTTLEMWKDVAPAISLCADIDRVIAQAIGPAT